jgi:hypothetical protein
MWGFLAGSAAILGGFALGGRTLSVDPLVLTVLVTAGVLAVAGAAVVAAAYRDVAKRR